MSIDGLNVLAIVPARGGSKGIPRKNLRVVGGFCRLLPVRPEWRLRSHGIDTCVLSTDDEEIAEEGRCHGLDVPFMRPEALSGDTALGVDVWRHARLASEDHYGNSLIFQ